MNKNIFIIVGIFLFMGYFMICQKYPKNSVFVKNENVTLWTQHFGNKKNPAVLLIHGSGSLATIWPDSFCQTLSDNDFFVIRYDQRDAGWSTHFEKTQPMQPGPYGAQELVDDAWSVLDHYSIEKAHLIGHSMGGYMIELMLIQKPARCLSSILISAGVSQTSEVMTQLNVSARPKKTNEILFSNNPQGDFEKDWPGWKRSIEYLHGSYPLEEAIAKQYTKDIYTRDKRDVGVAWNHIATFSTYPDTLVENLKKVQTPVLVIHGKEDYLVPWDHGQSITKLIPNSQFILLDKVGHLFFNKTLWERLTKIILPFLKKIKPFF